MKKKAWVSFYALKDILIHIKKNLFIKNLKNIKLNQNNLCFHAGTILENNKILAVGGRVLNFVSLADSFLKARENIIDNIKILNWKDGFYRKDIGFKVINEWELFQVNLKEEKS